jgi:hypothetical protein
MDAENLLKNVPSQLDKYIIDMELQHINYFIFCAVHFVFRFMLEK